MRGRECHERVFIIFTSLSSTSFIFSGFSLPALYKISDLSAVNIL